MFGIAYTIEPDDIHQVHIPYEQVVFEEQKRISKLQVKVRYIFKDYSEIEVLYTPKEDRILDRKPANITTIIEHKYR